MNDYFKTEEEITEIIEMLSGQGFSESEIDEIIMHVEDGQSLDSAMQWLM